MSVPAPFDPHAASPEERLAVAELLCTAHAAAAPGEPPLLPEREAQGLLTPTPGHHSARWVVWDAQASRPRALAYAGLSGSLTENRHAAQVRVLVHPGARRQGLGRALALTLREYAAEQGRTTLLGSSASPVPAGAAFSRALGAIPVQERRQSRLVLAELDEALLRRWAEPAVAPAYRLHRWEGAVPDEQVARYADLLGVIGDAPQGEVELEAETYTPEQVRVWEREIAEQGERLFMLVLEDLGSGQLVGLTETVWSPERPATLSQHATAVRSSARGQGLGKWLKAAMLLHLRAAAPGACFVRTGNAEGNAAMLAINTALGFRAAAAVTVWKWERPA